LGQFASPLANCLACSFVHGWLGVKGALHLA